MLVEDEPKIAAFIHNGLTENGHEVTVAYDGRQGFDMACQRDFDVLVLDVMLPNMNGIDICSQLRKRGVQTPILMLTALGATEDKVHGLQQGADDYLVKPFHFAELVARLEALTRRQYMQHTSDQQIAVGDLVLDRMRKCALREGREIPLTAREYALLEMFMQNVNRVLSRADIAERVWGYDFDSSSNVIDVYINYLRKKIEHGFSSKMIHTLIGMGYVMKP